MWPLAVVISSDQLVYQFFASYTTLIRSTNYVTKRQSLKLLGEILLDRANFSVMTRYIANEANLKMMMNLLRDKSKNIQFEAFHVFKVRHLLLLSVSLGFLMFLDLCTDVGHRSLWRTQRNPPRLRRY